MELNIFQWGDITLPKVFFRVTNCHGTKYTFASILSLFRIVIFVIRFTFQTHYRGGGSNTNSSVKIQMIENQYMCAYAHSYVCVCKYLHFVTLCFLLLFVFSYTPKVDVDVEKDVVLSLTYYQYMYVQPFLMLFKTLSLKFTANNELWRTGILSIYLFVSIYSWLVQGF